MPPVSDGDKVEARAARIEAARKSEERRQKNEKRSQGYLDSRARRSGRLLASRVGGLVPHHPAPCTSPKVDPIGEEDFSHARKAHAGVYPYCR